MRPWFKANTDSRGEIAPTVNGTSENTRELPAVGLGFCRIGQSREAPR